MSERKPAVVAVDDIPMQPVPGANASFRVTVNRAVTGCQNLEQRIFRFEEGTSPTTLNEESEEVFYVVSGNGEANIGGKKVALRPDMGILIPQTTPYTIHNPGLEPLEIVSVISPQPGYASSVPPSTESQPIGDLSVHESDEEELPAGGDRFFKLMIDPRYGSRYVTQFVGFIDKSRAPDHTHTYEEVIYILSGEGIVHIEGGDYPIRAGSTVYLPPGVHHCLENASEERLRLLGVFCPAGSPADKKEKS